MYLNNDVLSIISLYTGFKINFIGNKLKVDIKCDCDSCHKRIRCTPKTAVEAFAFPRLWEIDDAFKRQDQKYIKDENTFILHNNKMIAFNDALNNGLIDYRRYTDDYFSQTFDTYLNSGLHLYGNKMILPSPDTKIYVRKPASLEIFYKNLRDQYDVNTNEELYPILKPFFEEGIDENILKTVLKKINIVDKPIKLVVRLCSKCRKELKKGRIFV